METNKVDENARKLLDHEFPEHYVWKPEEKIWVERKKGKSIGHVHHVPPVYSELFYLRVLLNKVRVATHWKDFKNFEGGTYPTYKDTCQARGLLEDDKEYVDGLLEASTWGSGHYLRSFYVTLIMTDSMSHPEKVYEKTWHVMADDVEHIELVKTNNPGI